MSGATIDTVTAMLGGAVTGVVGSATPAVSAVVVADVHDLDSESDGAPGRAVLVVGTDDDALTRWLDGLTVVPPTHRPRAVFAKGPATPAAAAAATGADVVLVALHPDARVDRVHRLVTDAVDHARHVAHHVADDLPASDADLASLARTVARSTGGLVSIEDEHSRVLAYSASDEFADDLRRLSILGGTGPGEYLRDLRAWGVFDRIRESEGVVEVPAHPELGLRRRLVVAVRHTGFARTPGHARDPDRILGTIWLQEGPDPLAPESAEILLGAAAIAGRIRSRVLDAPSAEALLVRRLFGEHGGGVDPPSFARAWNLPVDGPSAVIGFGSTSPRGATELGIPIRLAASAFRADSVTTTIDGRVYVLVTTPRSTSALESWARQVVDRLPTRGTVCAAIAPDVAGLAGVAGARVEVDRVVDEMLRGDGDRVQTVEHARTPVLLGRILDAVDEHDLADDRLDTLVAYDERHATDLVESLERHLAAHGDVRSAAAALSVHPNTLRYRVRRATELLGIDLADPTERLLLEIQLAVLRRRRER